MGDVSELADARKRAGVPEDESLPPVEDGGEQDGEAAGETETLFPLGAIEGDPKVTIKTLMKGNLPVKVTASLTSANVPLLGGLVDPNRPGRVMVSHEAASYRLIPQREGEPGAKRLVGWEVRIQLRSTYAEPASGYYSEEQVCGILEQAGVAEEDIPALLGRPVAA